MTLMTGKPGPETSPIAAGTVLPVQSPEASFHLGQIAAVRGALKLTVEACQRAGISVPEHLENDFHLAIGQFWKSFVRAFGATTEERRALETAGPPALIRFDSKEGIPVIGWPEKSNALTDMWGLFQLPPLDPAAQGPLSVGTPFQSVDPTNLPEATRKVVLRDTRHTSVAALHEVLTLQVGDLARQRDGVSDRVAWLRLQTLAIWYAEAATLAEAKLPPDHLRNWTAIAAGSLSTEDMIEGARRIDQLANTVRAIKTLALRMGAWLFRFLLDTSERAHPSSLGLATDAMFATLSAKHGALQQQLEGLNRGCTQALGVDPDTVDVRVAFAPDTDSLPQLLLIPRSARVTPVRLPRPGSP